MMITATEREEKELYRRMQAQRIWRRIEEQREERQENLLMNKEMRMTYLGEILDSLEENKNVFELTKSYTFDLNDRKMCHCNVISFYIFGTNDVVNIQVNLIEHKQPYTDRKFAYLQLKWNSRSCIITKQERECLKYIEWVFSSNICREKIYDVEEVITGLNHIRILVKSFSEKKRIEREKQKKIEFTPYV